MTKLMKRMKKLLPLAFIMLCLCACSKDSESEKACGSHNGKQLYKGPEGGCYYYNSNDNKTYVERSECNC